MIRRVTMIVVAAAACASLWVAGSWVRADDASGQTVVLDGQSSWRMFHELKPPVVDEGGGKLTPRISGVAWLDAETSEAPKGWQATDFDDSKWLRTTAHGGCQTAYLSRQCVRGKFEVTDTAKVQGLKLSVDYHGGLVVYVNGKEVARRNLPTGPITDKTVAEVYPLEAYIAPSGDLLAESGTYTAKGKMAGKPNEEDRRRIGLRDRKLDGLAIPASALRKGVNVVAIELIRSPYNKVLLETDEQAKGKNRRNKFDWYSCYLGDIRLTAGSDAGLVPNTQRPAGLQVWNSDSVEADGRLDWGDRCEPLRAVELVTARNGTASGKVVVGSDKAISGLKASAGELKGPGGTIPASAVKVRYGYSWGTEDGFTRGEGSIEGPYSQWPGFFGAVVDNAPAEIAVEKVNAPAVAGAVMPVWVSVRTPKDARAGVYTGELKIEATGEKPVTVSVRLEVTPYTLSDPQDYRTWVELIQSPDTLEVEYETGLWTEKHWALIAKSLREISNTGSRVVYVPAIAHTNLGNAESMIRWVPKGKDKYEWDFSIMDRYLDLAEKELGTPKIVVLQVWDLYMSTKESVAKRFSPELDERQKNSEGRPLVTVLDRSTGKTENAPAPDLTAPASKAIWSDLLSEVRKRLKARGIEKTLMLGMFTDAVPPKSHIQFFNEIAPDVAWVQQGHGRWLGKVYDIAEVGYQTTVWGGFRFGDGLRQTNQKDPPIVESLHGWMCPRLDAVFERNNGLDTYPTTRWRFYPETAITGELRGIGRIGADYWKAIKDRRDRRVSWIHSRFPEGGWAGSWINLVLCSSVLAPGPEGPTPTTRLVAMEEGIQECEARIAIERALVDPKLKARLGPELANRCQKALDERLYTMWRTLSNFQLGGPFFFGAGAWRWAPGITGHRWYQGMDHNGQTRTLYELAAEVTAKVGEDK